MLRGDNSSEPSRSWAILGRGSTSWEPNLVSWPSNTVCEAHNPMLSPKDSADCLGLVIQPHAHLPQWWCVGPSLPHHQTQHRQSFHWLVNIHFAHDLDQSQSRHRYAAQVGFSPYGASSSRLLSLPLLWLNTVSQTAQPKDSDSRYRLPKPP
jgi:hypothetical protein